MVQSLWENSIEFPQQFFTRTTLLSRASQVIPVVKNPPANAGDTRDAG